MAVFDINTNLAPTEEQKDNFMKQMDEFIAAPPDVHQKPMHVPLKAPPGMDNLKRVVTALSHVDDIEILKNVKQFVFLMLVLLCRTFVAWSGFCIPNYFLGQQNNESVFPRKTKKSKNMAFLFPISHQSKPASFEIFVLNMCTFGKRQRLAVNFMRP